jgi:peptide/nickel transport system substrate-binding protein
MKSQPSKITGVSRHRGVRLIIAAAVAALTLAGCTASPSTGSSDAPVAGGTLTIGVGQDVGKLDPNWSNLPTYDQFAYATPVYETADGKFEPYLAESWEFGADAKSITLTLRSDAKFSDGTTVDAKSVVDSINRFITTPSFKLPLFGSQIAGVKATGDATVELDFKVAVPQSYALGILNQDSVVGMVASEAALANPDSLNTGTYGAGPYMLDPAQTTSGTQYTYVKNPNFFAPDAVTYDTIVIKPFSDPSALANAVTTGQVTYALELLAPQAATAKDAGLTISKGALGLGASGTGMLVFGNHTDGPLGDVKVRQALAYAIPRDDINTSLYAGLATATSSATPPGAAGYTGEDPYAYNADKAKQLLADAGYPNGFDLTITDPSAYDPGNLLGQAVQGALEKIGVHVTLEQNNDPFTDLTGKVLSGAFPAYIYSEPGESVFNMVTGSLSPHGAINPNNTPLPDDVSAALSAVTDAPADKQDDLLKALTKAVDTNEWSITLISIPRFTVVQPGVKNVPAEYVTAEPNPFSPIAGESWYGN